MALRKHILFELQNLKVFPTETTWKTNACALYNKTVPFIPGILFHFLALIIFFFAWHPPKTKLDYTNQIVQLFLNLHPFSIFFADPRSGFDPVQSPQNPLWRESPEETEMHLGCSIRKILCPLWRLPQWQSVVRAEKMGLSPIYCNHSC